MAERALQQVPDSQSRSLAQINTDIDLIKRTFAKGLNDDELELYLASANNLGLSIIGREIYAVIYNAKDPAKRTMSLQVGIDGYRKVAARSSEYAGQDGPYWCGPDGEWKDVWLSSTPPAAAKVGIWRKGFTAPLYAVALFNEYRNSLNSMWNTKPAMMIAKCAEGAAIRKGFADNLAGTYTREEMEHANAIETSGRVVDRETGEITETTSRQSNRSQQSAPTPITAADKDAKAKQNIINSIVGFGAKWQFGEVAITAAALKMAGASPDSTLADLPIAKLSKAFNDMTADQKADPPAFEQWVIDAYQVRKSTEIIDVESSVEQGELIATGAGGFDQ